MKSWFCIRVASTRKVAPWLRELSRSYEAQRAGLPWWWVPSLNFLRAASHASSGVVPDRTFGDRDPKPPRLAYEGFVQQRTLEGALPHLPEPRKTCAAEGVPVSLAGVFETAQILSAKQ